jgi:prevent-host-death family protein
MADTKVEIDTESPLFDLVDRAISGQDIITLTNNGQEKAVLLSVEAFEQLIGIQASRQRDLISIDELRSQFKQALAEAGYNTR